jgi:hypothetical protein
VKRSQRGEGAPGEPAGAGPPALKGDAPRDGESDREMRGVLPSRKQTNRSGRPSTRLSLLGCGEGSQGCSRLRLWV